MAMRPSGVTTVLDDIVLNDRRTVVECGGGVSTIYIARLLDQLGAGHLYTVEEDIGWASRLSELLARDDLNARVTVITAPLVPSGTAEHTQPWYSEEALQALPQGGIDLLLIDGPVASTRDRRHARYPALPFFHSRMADRCTVVLDDISRRGEQELIDRWEQELDLKFERRLVDGSIAIAQRGHGFFASR
jgi:predicted O-methyltransferase YrrM